MVLPLALLFTSCTTDHCALQVQAHPAILTDEPHDAPVEFTSSANLEMMTRKSSATSLEEGEKGGYQVRTRHLDEDDLFR